MTDAEYLEMLEAEHSMRCNDPDLFDEINEFEDMEDYEWSLNKQSSWPLLAWSGYSARPLYGNELTRSRINTMTQVQISTLIDTYQQDHAKGLLTHKQLLALVWRLDRMSAHCSQSANAEAH